MIVEKCISDELISWTSEILIVVNYINTAYSKFLLSTGEMVSLFHKLAKLLLKNTSMVNLFSKWVK